MTDLVREPLERFVRSVMLASEYSGSFACQVQAQNSDGTVDVVPDDSRLGTHSKVPVKWGTPGSVATFTSGARAILRFQNGDPRRPFVSSFDVTNLIELRLGATSARGDEVTEKSVLGTQYRSAEDLVFSKLSSAAGANAGAASALQPVMEALKAVAALLPAPAAAALTSALTAVTTTLTQQSTNNTQVATQIAAFNASPQYPYLSNVVKLR